MIGALAALLPFATFALGLGKLTVRSALNEPLNAEIEITSVAEKELKGIQVGLAPRADFDQAGVERLSFLSDIKFNVSKRADGNYFIQLLTDRQIEEPFLHLLLAVEWPGGKMVREYTALIDPPVQSTGKPSGIEVPRTAAAAPAPVVTPVPVPAQPAPEPVATETPKPVQPPVAERPATPAPAPAEPKPAEAARPAAPSEIPMPPVYTPPPASTATVEPLAPKPASQTGASTAAGWAMEGGYQVKWGDTAWRIAESLRTDNKHTIEQVVLALYRTNPQAFFDNNVNNLKAGQILKVPESTDIEAVVPVEARTQFRAQYDAWQEYKIKLAGASGAIKVVDAEAKPAAAAAKPTEPVKPDAAKKEPAKVAQTPADKAKQDEMLKIVRSTMQGDKTTPDKKPAEGEAARGAKEQQSLADRVAMTEESLASKQMESKEIGEKLSQVRAQLKRESRLIQIEQQQLAAAQTKAQPKPTEPAPVPAPTPKVEAPAKPEPVPAPKVEAPKAAEPPAVAPTPAPAPAPSKPAPTAAQKPPAPAPAAPAEEKGFVDDLLESVTGGDSLMPIVLGVVVLLSGGIAFVYLNRRRRSIAEFEESILQSEGIGGTTGGDGAVTTDTSGQVVSTGDTSFLSDFSQGGMGNIHTDEVDPIAEAEVYLAYGRDETAEEILKEAMVKNPAREEIKLKLLEIYANRSDVRAFETLAEEMYASMGGRPSKNWPRVEELGRKLNPNNPMFKGGGAGAATAVAAAPAALGFTDTAKMKATMPPNMAMTDTQTGLTPPAASGGVTESAGGFDFDMNASASPAPDDGGFDLDLGSDAAGKKADDDAIDFSVDLGKGDADDSGLDLDLGRADSNAVDFDFGGKEEPVAAAAEGGDSPQWDETATKLDLARAYVDMGDSEGARSILDEVMAEGNDQQKKQAKELAAQIG